MECHEKNGKEVDILSEEQDELTEIKSIGKKGMKLSTLRAPSFEGYFASGSKSFAYNKSGEKLTSTIENKIGEIQAHLEHIISLLREIDMLRMAVRVESRYPHKKRYLTVVQSDADHSAIVGIDWHNESSPTIGIVLPIWNATESKLDGDGGLHITRTIIRNHVFKPVSVQTLWSAKQVIDKAIDKASSRRYFEGMSTDGFLEYYEKLLSSDTKSMAEWNEMGDPSLSHIYECMSGADPDARIEAVKETIRKQLREVMRKVDLDEVTVKQILVMVEENLGMDLKTYKKFINEEMLVVMGQMDSASQILDYLYLGSEWNASSLLDLKELGIGYILNISREVDNFFPQTFNYYNIRVYDEEETELLKHWDHTYRFIEKARENNSKVLVHCRYGISRSASTVIAYLMKKMGWGMIETLEYVKGIRSIVEPNQGFQKQLIIYEGILNSSRNRFSSLFDQKPCEPNDIQKAVIEKRKRLSELHKNQINLEITQDIILDKEKNINSDLNHDGTMTPEDIDGCVSPEKLDTSAEEELNNSTTSLGRKRLYRAKTTCSGAVLIDEGEGETITDDLHNDSIPPTTCNHEDADTDMADPDEDRLMEQAVIATQMKNELMGSIKELHPNGNCVVAHQKGEGGGGGSFIRPSELRRAVSHAQST